MAATLAKYLYCRQQLISLAKHKDWKQGEMALYKSNKMHQTALLKLVYFLTENSYQAASEDYIKLLVPAKSPKC